VGQAIQSLHVRSQACVTSLVHDLLHPLHVPYSHGTSKFSDHVILSFDIIIQIIKSFNGVYLPFEHYVYTAQTAVNN